MQQSAALKLNGALAQKASYSAVETCFLLGISERTLRRHEARGLIRSCKAMSHKRYPATEIQRYLEVTL